MVAAWKEDTRTDTELLARFILDRDEQAFNTLVGRHGQLVWGVCLRVLRNPADADDAFQATFLRLARDAGRIRSGTAIASWLYRAARCSAIDLRRSIGRQRRIEGRLAEVTTDAATTTGDNADLRVVLDEELDRLPEQYRSALILCYLEGRTYADAALDLGCSVAAVHRRLVGAQDLLRRRLARKGKAALALIWGPAVAATAGYASPAPPKVLAATVDAVVKWVATGTMPATRAGLLLQEAGAEGVSLTIGVSVLGAILVAASLMIPGPEVVTAAPVAPTSAQSDPGKKSTSSAGMLAVTGVVRGPAGEAVPGASVEALIRSPYQPGARGLRDVVASETTADRNGRFAVQVPADFPTWFAERVVTVRATAPGLAPITRSVRFAEGSGAADVTLSMPTGSPLQGRLIGPFNEPAVGVRVDVIRAGDVASEPVVGKQDGSTTTAVTDANGTYTLPGLGSTANVWVRVADPRFSIETVRADAVRHIQLVPARTLTVRVETEDGVAIPAARLTLVTDRPQSHAHLCATDHGVRGPTAVEVGEIDAVADAQGECKIPLEGGDVVELTVSPPEGTEPLVGVRRRLTLERNPGAETVRIRLPRGAWVTGRVTDAESGSPLNGATVHWGRLAATLPEWKDDVLVGRDALVRTDADGVFRLAVLPGACSIRVHGPALDYPAVPIALPGTKATTLFAHAEETLGIVPGAKGPNLTIALRRVPNIPVSVSNADEGTIAVISGRVSPVRGYAAIPLPVRSGKISVPGCVRGVTSTVYVLDPKHCRGAVTTVKPGEAVPPVRLMPCGSARLRVVGPDGFPRDGAVVGVQLLAERDRSGPNQPESDAQPADWFDPVNYPRRPITDKAGFASLPALIPGARYCAFVMYRGVRVSGEPFVARSGEEVELPDLQLPKGVDAQLTKGAQR